MDNIRRKTYYIPLPDNTKKCINGPSTDVNTYPEAVNKNGMNTKRIQDINLWQSGDSA